jgi:hypothetical protein
MRPLALVILLVACRAPAPEARPLPAEPSASVAAPEAVPPAAPAPEPVPPDAVVLRCEEVIDATESPPAGWVSALDVAAVSPGPHGSDGVLKVPLLLRAGATVDLLLPEGSPHRFVAGWQKRLTRHVRMEGCRGVGALNAPGKPANHAELPWVVFAGGLSVSGPACVEIAVREGARTGTLRIAAGADCPG